MIDKLAKKHLVKKSSFREGDGVSKKKIPTNVRRLLRKKLKLSKKRFASSDWFVNNCIEEQIEEVDLKLHSLYNERRIKNEMEAI